MNSRPARGQGWTSGEFTTLDPTNFQIFPIHASYPPGPVIFCPGFPPLPTNDAFANATVLRGSGTGICGANALLMIVGVPNWQATAEAGEPPHGGVAAANSVWYRWTAPATGLAEVRTAALVAIYTGNTLATLIPVASSLNGTFSGSDRVRFAATAGQTYQIAVDRAVIVSGIGLLPVAPGQFTLTVQLATLQLVAPERTNSYAVGQPIEFEFAPFDAVDEPSELRLFAGGEITATLTNAPWRFTYTATNAGNVAVWAQGSTTNGAPIISWPVTFMFRPANDDFSNATAIADWISGGTFSANTAGATAEPGEPESTPGTPAGATVWWRWVAPYSAETTITLVTAGKLTGFKGDDLASLERVFHLEKESALVISIPPSYATSSFQAEAGATYYFSAEGRDSVVIGIGSALSQPVSWKLEQRTLEMQPATAQSGWIDVAIPLTATSIETDSPPVQVDFILGVQRLNPWGYTPYPIGSLGTVTNPPYGVFWVPQQPGIFCVWARSTNSHGIVHETAPTVFRIFAANDQFVHATEIAPATVTTNFEFNLDLASMETGEPPHRIGPARNTLWWKWTPSYSGLVRFKAVRYQTGLPLEIFTGNTLEGLRRIAHNNGRVSVLGLSGAIRLRVKIGETYYVRVDNDPRLLQRVVAPGSVEFPPDAILTLEPAGAPLPAEVNFSLIASLQRGSSGVPTVAVAFGRVFLPNGAPVPEYYRAQLYAGTTQAGLQPVGVAQPFYDSGFVAANPSFAGLFEPALVFVPDCVPRQRVFVQIRVWNSNVGQTYEAARAGGSLVGASEIKTVIAGSEDTGPAPLLGIGSFRVGKAAP